MKKFIFTLVISLSMTAFGQQQFGLSKKATPPVADTSSYSIVENPDNIDVHNDLQIRKKISYYRKKDVDFLLDFGNGLKVLIYKEEE